MSDDSLLLVAIKKRLKDLSGLSERMSGHWEYEDSVYRFYHTSFKVFWVQELTKEIVGGLHLPGFEMNERFLRIVQDGTGRIFSPEMNETWEAATRPIVEAFFHARYFLDMVVKYGSALEEPPDSLPSGWAAVLELYNLR